MADVTTTGLDLTPVWARFNEGLIRLVDYVPDDKLNWSPRDDLWNFRGILIHIAGARDGWLSGAVKDGDPDGAHVWHTVRTKDDIKQAYARTWDRLERFLNDPARLAASYGDEDGPVTGHWIAFHLLEHDIHHRADIFHYLSALDIKHPEIGTP